MTGSSVQVRQVALVRTQPRGGTGNTSDSGSEDSRFEPWRGYSKVKLWRGGRVAKGGALLRRWGESPTWVRIPPPPLSGRRRVRGMKDGWPSGLRRTIGNRVGLRPRGFESHPVRLKHEREIRGTAMRPATQRSSGAWLSPVERCVRVAEVPGSNPGAPIDKVTAQHDGDPGSTRGGKLATANAAQEPTDEGTEDRRRRPQVTRGGKLATAMRPGPILAPAGSPHAGNPSPPRHCQILRRRSPNW